MKEGRWIWGWETSVMDLAGTEYEELLFLTQEKLLQMLKESMSEIDTDWEWYSKSGERFGISEERSHPDLSYVYGQSLDKSFVLSWILRYKLVNQQRLINQVLTQEKQAQLKIQLTSILKGDADISYTELLGLFPEIEAELVLEDLIESGQLKRQMRRRQKAKEKLRRIIENKHLRHTDQYAKNKEDSNDRLLF